MLASGGKEGGRFSFSRESAGADFLVEDFTSFPNLEDSCLAGDEGDFLGSHGLDFRRHTVGFGEVVSLSAIFDLNHWGDNLDRFPIFANDFVSARESLWSLATLGEEGRGEFFEFCRSLRGRAPPHAEAHEPSAVGYEPA